MSPSRSDLLSVTAHKRIKRDIICCRLLPGSEVTELDLAERYELGRTPIREALSRLAQEGLVRAIPRWGYQISPITIRDVQDIFALRLLLETEAARLAAGNMDPEKAWRLDAICSAGYDPANPESAEQFLRVNAEFHIAIAQASGNERMTKILAQLLYEMERLFHVGLRIRNRTEEMAHEHRDLVHALLSGDGEASKRIAAAQIETARNMVMDGLLSRPDLITVSLT